MIRADTGGKQKVPKKCRGPEEKKEGRRSDDEKAFTKGL